MSYAENTSVSIEKSRAELDTLLRKHGASQRVFGDDDVNGRAVICFALGGRQYQLEIPLPKLSEFERCKRRGWMQRRTMPDQLRAHDQACRSRWRAVVLITKAKLEFASMGVSTIEREFLADLVLADGQTVHAAVTTGIQEQYLTGKPIALLGPASRTNATDAEIEP